MASRNQVNIGLIATIGIAGTLLTVIAIVGVQAWYYAASDAELAAKRASQPELWVTNLKLDQEARISNYRWVDAQKQIVAIPIDRAMKMLIDRAATRPTTQASDERRVCRPRAESLLEHEGVTRGLRTIAPVIAVVRSSPNTPARESSVIGGMLLTLHATHTSLAATGGTPVLPRAEALPAQLEGVGVTEKLNAKIPLDATFTDETGKAVQLKQLFGRGRPVVLQIGYFGCPMLCGLISEGMVASMKEIPWRLGKEYDAITLSVDPSETSQLGRQKKENYIKALGDPAAADGWHCLTGDQPNIERITQSVGFGYRWDERQKQFAHAAVLIVLTPDGRVSRYLYGVQFPPRTLRLSLVEASEGKIGTAGDQVLLFCYHYDPKTGQYTLGAMNFMRAGGALCALILAAILVKLFLGERRRGLSASPQP